MGDNMVDWLVGCLVGWLVASILFNTGALYRRKRVRVLMVLSSSPSSLDATRKRKKVFKGVQSLVKR
uniref:Transmembrane protein n=1 Tax=Arundo donax TaxID=35708 RepID=A0A0A9D7T8_ARUDO